MIIKYPEVFHETQYQNSNAGDKSNISSTTALLPSIACRILQKHDYWKKNCWRKNDCDDVAKSGSVILQLLHDLSWCTVFIHVRQFPVVLFIAQSSNPTHVHDHAVKVKMSVFQGTL